jgi:hypothetical protein
MTAAKRKSLTGVSLSEPEYKLRLGLWHNVVNFNARRCAFGCDELAQIRIRKR